MLATTVARTRVAARNGISAGTISQRTMMYRAGHTKHGTTSLHSDRSPASRRLKLGLTAIAGSAFLLLVFRGTTAAAEQPPAPADLVFEKKRKRSSSAEGERAALSSQHAQVLQSWARPGVYAWGSNTGLVVAPDSSEPAIKTPRRFPFFDGKVLRDLKLDRRFGAAVTENGDLLQWGVDYSADFPGPEATLTGKDIAKIELTKDSVVALSRSGRVYTVPVSREVQAAGPKHTESSYVPFMGSSSKISYAEIEVPKLGMTEKIKDIAAGQDHLILLTSSGRLLSALPGVTSRPCKGQLGHTAAPKPGRADFVPDLTNLKFSHIAAGDQHSVACDSKGRVFTWGDNAFGQLGLDPTPERQYSAVPTLLPLPALYKGTGQLPLATAVAAGAAATLFCVDARATVTSASGETVAPAGRTTADVWACGTGISGLLGNGRWTHVQGVPSRVRALSGLFEYDEAAGATVPIRVGCLSVGATHAAAALTNRTNVSVAPSAPGTAAKSATKTAETETNFGADVLFWGGNESYQLGTGRRNNVSTPMYIAPLDSHAQGGSGSGKTGSDPRAEDRFQLTPLKRVDVGGRMVEVEQRVHCGRGVTAVYSATPRN